MGIDGLNRLLESKVKTFKETLPLDECFGLRMGVDVSILFNAHWYICLGEALQYRGPLEEPDNDRVLSLWIPRMLAFVEKMISHGIIPVLIFDGEPPELKRKFAHIRRKDQKMKDYKKLDALIEETKSMDILSITSAQINDMNKLYQRTYSIKEENKVLIKSICDAFGIPTLKAEGEAEELCSWLCSTGEVDMVYSTDTDNYVHGCPYLITKMERYTNSFTVTCLSNILDGLKMTMEQFVELCCLIKNDYGENIKIVNEDPTKRPYSVGCSRAYTLLKKHVSADNLPDKYQHYIKNKEYGVNLEESKAIFSRDGKNKYLLTSSESHGSLDTLHVDYNKVLNGTHEAVSQYNLTDYIESLQITCKKMKDSTSYFNHTEVKTHKLLPILKRISMEPDFTTDDQNESILDSQLDILDQSRYNF
uniref:Flap endonuclease n=1 Tax=Pithovirus LCPAC101 TaxID=2506586 RepID=A0A481Z2M6_9VIRU|nr:MAG: flap endonuclease [Pithovirus LCPAC101]